MVLKLLLFTPTIVVSIHELMHVSDDLLRFSFKLLIYLKNRIMRELTFGFCKIYLTCLKTCLKNKFLGVHLVMLQIMMLATKKPLKFQMISQLELR
jgi:hypothetical protein